MSKSIKIGERPHRFPNKKIAETYEKAKGRTFTHSPYFQRFIDEDGCANYDYWSMMWLYDYGYIDRWLNNNPYVYRYKVK